MTEPRVGRVAYALGFAGLLPQVVATGMIAWSRVTDLDPQLPIGLTIVYPLAILSFVGGMWWAFAMKRGGGQGGLAAIAVVPSLAVVSLVGVMLLTAQIAWTLVAIGCAMMLTLLVDRQLANTGEAPEGWMALRVPLSLGLGALTILAGALLGSPSPVN